METKDILDSVDARLHEDVDVCLVEGHQQDITLESNNDDESVIIPSPRLSPIQDGEDIFLKLTPVETSSQIETTPHGQTNPQVLPGVSCVCYPGHCSCKIFGFICRRCLIFYNFPNIYLFNASLSGEKYFIILE